jgi:hypothetical protein
MLLVVFFLIYFLTAVFSPAFITYPPQESKQKGGGTPNPFTVSRMPFFRRRHLKRKNNSYIP